jgi:hypothetical protein
VCGCSAEVGAEETDCDGHEGGQSRGVSRVDDGWVVKGYGVEAFGGPGKHESEVWENLNVAGGEGDWCCGC